MSGFSWKTAVRAAAVVASAALAAGTAAAQDAAAFYKGKQVRFYTMGGPGGGFDIYMRTMIPYLERQLGAKFLPLNESAAGGLVAMNRTVQAPPDGLTILLTMGEAAIAGQLYGVAGARYDVKKLEWLARVSSTPKVILFGPKTPFKTFADVLESDRTIIFGGSGKTDGNADFAAIVAHSLGINAKMVIGYKGSRGMLMAVERGETDAQVLTDESGYQASQRGPIRAVAILDRRRSDLFPGVPTIFEIAKKKPAELWMVDWRAKVSEAGRVLLTTPGTPKERVAALRAAVKEVLEDPGFLAESKRRKLSVDYASGEQIERIVIETVGNVDAKRVEEIRNATLRKYYTK